jgi:uncharacterized damage-inducible protein DinB
MNAEQAKFLIEYFAKMMEQEGKTTAKVIAAVPDDRRDYKPDEKSRSAWELATHLALGDIWFVQSIIDGSFNFDPDAEKLQVGQLKSIKDVVAHYSKEYPAKLQELRNLPADKLTKVVDFFGMFQWPNAAYIGFANNHSTHHRGQLAAYLRAMGSKVPSIYGGSADEPFVATATST